MEEARRDAGVTSDADYIRELNDAVGRKDVHAFTERMHPDAVWEHNIGTGSPEEGVYEGWEPIRQLFERVLEGWEYMRPEATEIRELEAGVYLVRGELHCRLPGTENEIVEPYEQRLEIRDGVLARGRMVVGSSVRG
jgi:ketosteroid isomerase-like protein